MTHPPLLTGVFGGSGWPGLLQPKAVAIGARSQARFSTSGIVGHRAVIVDRLAWQPVRVRWIALNSEDRTLVAQLNVARLLHLT